MNTLSNSNKVKKKINVTQNSRGQLINHGEMMRKFLMGLPGSNGRRPKEIVSKNKDALLLVKTCITCTGRKPFY